MTTDRTNRSLHRASVALLILALPLLLAPPLWSQPGAPPDGAGPGAPGPHGLFAPESGPGGGRGMDHGFPLSRIARFLDLSESQLEQARSLHEELVAAARPLHEDARRLHEELRGLLNGDAPDPAAVGARVLEIHEIREQGRLLRQELEADFSALLTPAQRERWDLLKDLRSLQHGPRHGRRGGPR